MIYDTANPYQREQADEYYEKLKDQGAIIEVKKKSRNRSLSQNAYLHVILSFFAAEYGCSEDEAKLDYFKRLCNRVIFEKTTTNKLGIEVKVLKSSSVLDKAEMTLAIDRFRNWSASNGIYLPAPDENDFLLHAQREIERVKEYL